MIKTTFSISHMDCPSEEQMIRMKLDGLAEIRSMEFDIPGRKLTVYHTGGHQEILKRLDSLNFGTSFENSVDTDEVAGEDPALQRRLLRQVLAINLIFFFLEIIAGFLANSMGLVADSLDMLADTIVYGLALYAAGGIASRKLRVARISGYFQMCLALLGFAEVIRRFIGIEPVPSFPTMIIVSALALAANTASLLLLRKSRSKEAHMQAGMIFTSNDILANLGVMAAGILVLLTNSKYPDLVIGALVFGLVTRGAWRILRLGSPSRP